jgi:LGFP repeat
MSSITVHRGVTIRHPTLRSIADSIVSAVNLATHRAIANSVDASRFPIVQEPASFEQAASRLFHALPRAKQDTIRSRVMPGIDRATPDIPRLLLTQPLSLEEFTSSARAEDIVLPRMMRRRSSETRPLSPEEVLQWPSLVSGSIGGSNTRAQNARTLRFSQVVGAVDVHVTPVTHERAIRPSPEQAIQNKYESLGGAQGFLGEPTSGLGTTPDGFGHYRHYSGGSIYHTFSTGAHAVGGAILEKWKSLGWEQSDLRFPTTDECKAPDGVGRYNHFQGGSIYWTPQTGAHAVGGAILQKWGDLGWEKSVLGYPTSDEEGTPDGEGRYNHFEHGSIYWTPALHAHEVHGEIQNFWADQGWEQGDLGYPLSDEMEMPEGGRCNIFQGGVVAWTLGGGPYFATSSTIDQISARVVAIHCIDETGQPGLLGEVGADDMQFGGTAISPNGEASMNDIALGQYNDGTWSHWAPKTLFTFGLNQNDGLWPKGFIVTLILVEKDLGYYGDFMKKVMAKAKEIAQDELTKQIAAGGGSIIGFPAGGPIGAGAGYLAGLIAVEVVNKVFNAVDEIFLDDIFEPATTWIDVPGPHALFPNNTWDTDDEGWDTTGHHGHYEWWNDWKVV